MAFTKGLAPHNKIADLCSIEGCGRKHHSSGYCYSHAYRAKRYGNPLEPDHKPTGRPLKGEVPTWTAIHKRLSRSRGPANRYQCIDCTGSAAEWSYDGCDPDEFIGMCGQFALRYSLNLDHYQPRCRSCHRKFDGAGDRPRTERGTFVGTSEVKA